MSNPDRPQAPGYLANLMARLFHDVSGAGLRPLGIRPEHFPILVELWFGDSEVTRESLCLTQEADAGWIDDLVEGLVAEGLVETDPAGKLKLTEKATAARDAALQAARRANDAARNALSEDELDQLMTLMNRVIDALQAAKG